MDEEIKVIEKNNIWKLAMHPKDTSNWCEVDFQSKDECKR